MPVSTMELPPKIHGLLSDGLIPSGLPENDTEKFFVEGHPDLLVRLNSGCDMETMLTAKTSWNRLARSGVSVLPSRLVSHEEEVYVVTKKVTGLDLDIVLRNRPNDDAVRDIDHTWKGIADHLADSRKKRKEAAGECINPWQYMLGTITGDGISRVRFVDLSPYLTDVYRDTVYDSFLLLTANSLIDMEAASNRRFPLARRAIIDALDLGGNSSEFGDSLSNATRFVLDQCDNIFASDQAAMAAFRTK